MNPIYHLLSSDIPQHNQSVLDFFQSQLLPVLADQQHIFYVVNQTRLQEQYPALKLHCFNSKGAIAKAVLQVAKKEPNAQFILHGQYNVWLWCAILVGKLPAYRCYWHIWGADLYQASTDWRFKLFYPLRRLAQQKFTHIWATRGDLAYVAQHLARQKRDDRLGDFPTKMRSARWLAPPKEHNAATKITILLGNSGDPANQHLTALTHIKQSLSAQSVKIIIPMGYPAHNQRYIQQVKQQAERLFPVNTVQILTEKLSFTDYLALLQQCDLGYFNFTRQQGIGTLCLLIQLGIPCVLHRQNPFTLDMDYEQIPFLYHDQLNVTAIRQTQRQLAKVDKQQIAFFAPNYAKQWISLLTEVSQKQ